MSNELRNFLALSYDELEDLNLKAKEQRQDRVAAHKIQEERLKYLTDEKRIKAVTVLFSDLEGRLHMLDYDKKFLIKSWDNLTFDGSSIRGFTAQRESDLRLAMDWGAFYWAPADVFGSGEDPGFRPRDRQGRHAVLGGYSRAAEGLRGRSAREEGLHAERRERNRRVPFQRAGRRATLPRNAANSNTSTPAGTTTRCPGIRCARLSTRPRKCNAPWASRTRRTIRRSRRRNSRSTTDTAKWSPPPIKFSCTS